MDNQKIENKDFYTADELSALEIDNLPWLLENIFPEQGIGFVTGPSDSNKTTFIRQLATCIIEGKEEFLGIKLNVRSGNVLIVSTEDDKIGTAYQLRKQKFQRLPKEVKIKLGYFFKPIQKFHELEQILKKTQVDVIVFDTWTDCYGGDINNAVPVRENLSRLSELATKYGLFVLNVHHTRKAAENQAPSKNLVLGSQAIEAKSRVVVDIRREGSQNQRRISIVKGNYIPDSIKSKAIIVEYNTDTHLLERVGEVSSGYGFKSIKNDKEEYLQDLIQYLEQRLTQDEMVLKLGEKYPDRKTPSKGTINKWLQELRA